eukprot:TRINITY_DN23894_c0_g1_i9.p1 TRINITY_DN23894_c0_g1~~TRINITY_DN23894_c0_g1_i9.p1  ORF type:complete len:100 (-),score=19.25 TRINITY_DN23894_c0_g1_i9:11-310(-)
MILQKMQFGSWSLMGGQGRKGSGRHRLVAVQVQPAAHDAVEEPDRDQPPGDPARDEEQQPQPRGDDVQAAGPQHAADAPEIGRAVQQECRDRSRMPSSA